MILRICCKASIQLFCKIKACVLDSEIIMKVRFNTNLQNKYIMMQQQEDEADEQMKMMRFYQLSQICKNIQILQSYEMKLSTAAVCWADW